MSWLETGLDFLTKHSDTIAKVGGAAKNIWSAFNQNNAQQNVRNGYMDIQQQILANALSQKQKDLDFVNAQAAARGSGGGARGPSISPAAMMKQQKDQQKAEKKGFEALQKSLSGISQSYQPFIDAGKSVLPKQTENYNQYLDQTAMLSNYLGPAALKAFQTPSQAAYDIKVPGQAYRVAAPQSNVQIPNLAELLRRG